MSELVLVGHGHADPLNQLERSTAELLEAVESLLRDYVVVGKHQRTALCLWVLHTHTFHSGDGPLRAASEVTPYIQVHSATPGCGKSLLFEVLEAVVREPWKSDGITKSVLVRKMDALCPTLLLDEMDRMLAGDKELAAALEAVLNSGYRRRGVYSMSAPTSGGGWRFVDFRVFAPKAFAGIGRLTGPLATRTIPIWLHPRLPNEAIREKFEDELWSETQSLRDGLATWGLDNIDRLAAVRTIDVPGGLPNRTREIWRPLLAIADPAGQAWGQSARAAAVALHASHPDELHYRVRLLVDIRAAFDTRNADRLHTTALIQQLATIEESPWSSRWWDSFNQAPKSDAAASLAKILRDYGIRPVEAFAVGTVRARGYKREQFEDAWLRYLPAPPAVAPVTPVSPDSTSQTNRHGQHGQHEGENQTPQDTIAANTTPRLDPDRPHLVATGPTSAQRLGVS